MSAATLSGQPTRHELFSLTDEAAIGHIELSPAADLVVVAPATANLLARMAGGHADDMATTLLLATDKRTLVAPAMNVRMWLHPATQRNVDRLGPTASCSSAPKWGRWPAANSVRAAWRSLPRSSRPLNRLSPPVRALERILRGIVARSRSPGRHVDRHLRPYLRADRPGQIHRPTARRGARATQSRKQPLARGARVTLGDRAGRIAQILTAPTVIHVETAREMRDAAIAALPADVFVAAAAVADWRVEDAAEENQEGRRRSAGPPADREP